MTALGQYRSCCQICRRRFQPSVDLSSRQLSSDVRTKGALEPGALPERGSKLPAAAQGPTNAQEGSYWWQRSVLSSSKDKKDVQLQKARQRREEHARRLARAREEKLRRLATIYHAAKTFPMGTREETLDAVDAEFLGRTPDVAPLPVNIETLLRDARNAGRDDDAKGLISAAKVSARADLFDQLDARRMADSTLVDDTPAQYAAHIGSGMHGKRAVSRAAKIFDALHGTSDLGQPKPSFESVWEHKGATKQT